MKEIWIDVDGYEGRYQISNLGNVRSTYRYYRNSIKFENKQVTATKDASGYLQILVVKPSGETSSEKIHRLIAKAFIPNPKNYPCINHKDEDKTNNKISNLEWCTVDYNNSYGTRNERIKETMTSLKGRAIIATKNGKSLTFKSIRSASRNLGISSGHITDALNGKHSQARGYVFKEVV